ncbi:MAG: hypothetical protein GX608_12875 [Lentisphaerae bacterium]|nr:hypothetical protein [Lentisphaerota bacterium]
MRFARCLRSILSAAVIFAGPAGAATRDLGKGFADHGIAAPVSENRGTAAAVDGKGRNLALVWLHGVRGAFALLEVDADTGRSAQLSVPFPADGDTPYSTLLSRGNRFYTHFGGHFCEYDPAARAFTFVTNTAPQMAMNIIEDENGVIWSVTYPQSGLVSFDPKTRAFKDYGQLYKQNWAQYPGGLSLDDAGWVYWGVGNTMFQAIAFDPRSKTVKTLVAEKDRRPGSASVFRAGNGKVYVSVGRKDGWLECHAGSACEVEGRPPGRAAFGRRRDQMSFPDGRRLAKVDLVERELVVAGPATNDAKRVRFDYESEGSNMRSIIVAPDGMISGTTMHSARFYSYDPRSDRWVRHGTYKPWNSVCLQGGRVFAGCYTGGILLEWDPAREWVEPGRTNSNPRVLFACAPVINSPRRILAHPDGKTIILAGRPGYGRTGGGLLFWDRSAETPTLLAHTNVAPNLSTYSLVALPGGKLLGGTATRTGQGGEVKAKEAELFIMDMATKAVEWSKAPFPGVQFYRDLALARDGLVYGFADQRKLFVFDPVRRKVIHEEDIGEKIGPVIPAEGSGVFVPGPGGELYVLFERGIGRLRPEKRDIVLLAESPLPISGDCGGACLDGRLYFASSSHLCSFKLPDNAKTGAETPDVARQSPAARPASASK